MPEVPILMPQLGESIAEAIIIRLNVAVGDEVVADQEVIEVETNKATMDVTTLCGGTVRELLVEEGVSYPVGTVLGLLEVTEEEAIRTGVQATGTKEFSKASCLPEQEEGAHFATPGGGAREPRKVEPSIRGLSVPAGMKGAHYLSPRMKARMDELGLRAADISAIVGSGSGGRVTVEDLEQFLEYVSTWPCSQASPMRLSVADSMRRSWTRPLASVGRQVALENLLAYRRSLDPKPPLTIFLLRAFGKALAEQPASAGYLIGEKIVPPRTFDIGVAVQVEDGVLVPVLRKVDTRTVEELMEEYLDLVRKARDRRVPEENTGGGIATVTNFGTFGLMWGTPIPLPSETLILGIGAGVKKPIWSQQEERFIPVTEADLILTFDHRVVDGGGAGMLLNRLNELLQKPETL
ncbi:MAG: dihydrolipoamide acetyltransferase family protein [Roseibacillus sp.]|jgi:pyruvate/2-oxoglutarate dehydrogenase complex dihydrolipoamide acyltransferase (E2) component|nr:dihydrolipoamide acetyltransferase family protein [Roseibacillus sp.]|tara:strand:- start:430 stop:1653 length:1224 start_codon:yes stop_codon:yes gene_type:complete